MFDFSNMTNKVRRRAVLTFIYTLLEKKKRKKKEYENNVMKIEEDSTRILVQKHGDMMDTKWQHKKPLYSLSPPA